MIAHAKALRAISKALATASGNCPSEAKGLLHWLGVAAGDAAADLEEQMRGEVSGPEYEDRPRSAPRRSPAAPRPR